MTKLHHWILASTIGAAIGFSGCWLLLRNQSSGNSTQSPATSNLPTNKEMSGRERSITGRRSVSQTHPDIYEIVPKDQNCPTHMTAWEEGFGVFWNTVFSLAFEDQDSIIASDSSRSEFVEQLGIVIDEQWRWRVVFESEGVVDGRKRLLVDAKIGFVGFGPRDGIYTCYECCLHEIWDFSDPKPKLLDRIRVGIENEGELNGESITHYVDGFDGLSTSSEKPLRRSEVSWPQMVSKDRK